MSQERKIKIELSEDEKEQCGICLNSVTYPGKISSCGHLFHYRCIFQWASYSNKCPLCRQSFCSIIYRKKVVKVENQAFLDADNQGINPENFNNFIICWRCGRGDNESTFLLCDGYECHGAFHMQCLGITEVPEGTWLCPHCDEEEYKVEESVSDEDYEAEDEKLSDEAVSELEYESDEFYGQADERQLPKRQPSWRRKRKRREKYDESDNDYEDLTTEIIEPEIQDFVVEDEESDQEGDWVPPNKENLNVESSQEEENIYEQKSEKEELFSSSGSEAIRRAKIKQNKISNAKITKKTGKQRSYQKKKSQDSDSDYVIQSQESFQHSICSSKSQKKLSKDRKKKKYQLRKKQIDLQLQFNSPKQKQNIQIEFFESNQSSECEYDSSIDLFGNSKKDEVKGRRPYKQIKINKITKEK